MNMVFYAAYHEGGAFPLLEDSRLIREEGIPMFFWNQTVTMLRAVHEMHEIFGQRLRHQNLRVDCAALSGLRKCSGTTHPGRCPGLVCCGPFGAGEAGAVWVLLPFLGLLKHQVSF